MNLTGRNGEEKQAHSLLFTVKTGIPRNRMEDKQSQHYKTDYITSKRN